MKLNELILKLESDKTLYGGDSEIIFQIDEDHNGYNLAFAHNAEVDKLGRVGGDTTEPYVRVKVTR